MKETSLKSNIFYTSKGITFFSIFVKYFFKYFFPASFLLQSEKEYVRLLTMPFSQVKGQEFATTLIENFLKKDSLPQSLLFYGQEGVGKKLCALTLSRILNCEREERPCGQCPNCLKIQKDIHPEVRLVAPPRDFILIDQIREIKKEIAFKPVLGRYRVYIIQEAHRIKEAAANAYLKILEEPPPQTIFILIAPTLYGFLPTILSRCEKVRFNPLSYKLEESILADWGLEKEKASSLAFLSKGSPGRALEYIDRDIFDKQAKVLRIIEGLKGKGWDYFLEAAEEISLKEEADLYLDLFAIYFQNLLRKEGSGRPSQILSCLKIILEAKEMIARYVNLKLVLEVMLLKLHKVLTRRR